MSRPSRGETVSPPARADGVSAPAQRDGRIQDLRSSQPSLGQLVGEIGNDLSTLFRQEVELAKAEVRQEAVKAGKAAGMLGGAGFAGAMTALLVTLAVMFGLGNVMDLGWAALIVAAVWAGIGAALFVNGRSRMKQVSPKPEQTIETLKEDAQWARHLTK